jgi:hypothetical protein
MKRTLALTVAGVLAAASLVAAPRPAQAQFGVSFGVGSGFGPAWDVFDDDPGFIGIGFGAPVVVGAPLYAPPLYAPPLYAPPVFAGPPVVTERVVRVVRRPARRVVVSYAQPTYYYAPRRVVRSTRVVTRAPRYVAREVVAAPAVRRTRIIRQTYY